RNCDTSHLNPGDKVSFRVMTLAPPVPTPAARPAAKAAATPTSADSTTAAPSDDQPKPEAADAPPQLAGSSETIGPFVVVQVGNRLGSLDVMKAAKITP